MKRPLCVSLVLSLSLLLALGCASSVTPQVASQHTGSDSLKELLDRISEWEDSAQPLSSLYDGQHVKRIKPRNLEDFTHQRGAAVTYRDQLLAIPSQSLGAQEQISQQIMVFKLTDRIDRLEFGEHLIPISAEGGFYNSLSSLARRLPFSDAADYDAFLGWLPSYAQYLVSHIALLEQGVDIGRIAPVVVVDNNLAMLKPLAEATFEDHPGMQPFVELPASIGADDQQRIREQGKAVYRDSIAPAYAKLHQFFLRDYRPKSPAKPGLSMQPGGTEHYENRVRFFTTLALTPGEVFDLGEREVARIESAMDKVREELGYSGSRAELIAELRLAPEHYPTSGQALLDRAAFIAKTIEGKLPQWFEPLYQLPFTIEPVPDAIAPTYTSGRYVSGNREQDRPGIYWVNTTSLDSRALFNLPALTLHEAVPGHHLQHARASELTAVHPFRNEYYMSAFGEGWGLYAEYLGEEMGIYQTPYERFGRLSYEMWRACRLVVDVGMHHRGWSRERAIEYLGSRTALSQLEVKNEIDRYIGWPGQALAYKLGELTIIGLRREAEVALGEKFDVKAFHEAVLGNGALPLQLLIDQVRLSLNLPGTGLPAGITPKVGSDP